MESGHLDTSELSARRNSCHSGEDYIRHYKKQAKRNYYDSNKIKYAADNSGELRLPIIEKGRFCVFNAALNDPIAITLLRAGINPYRTWSRNCFLSKLLVIRCSIGWS